MSRTILADVGGFTPIIDRIVREHGLMTAAVFGRVWRYCQFKDNVCSASMATIAVTLNIGTATVMRHLDILVKNGYLEDLTPDRRFRTHIYRDTGKASVRITIDVGVSESNAEEDGVSQRNAGVSERNAGVSERNAGVSESHLKILKETPQETEDINKLPSAENQSQAEPLRESASPKIFTAVEGERVFREVTGMVTFPGKSREDDLRRIEMLWYAHGQKLGEYLRLYWEAWKGRGYNRVNTGWIDWAIAGEVPRTKVEQADERSNGSGRFERMSEKEISELRGKDYLDYVNWKYEKEAVDV